MTLPNIIQHVVPVLIKDYGIYNMILHVLTDFMKIKVKILFTSNFFFLKYKTDQ